MTFSYIKALERCTYLSTILCTCPHRRTGLDQNNTDTNKTYIPVHKTHNQVLSGYITFLRKEFELIVDEENRKAPNIYWTPKRHQHPN